MKFNVNKKLWVKSCKQCLDSEFLIIFRLSSIEDTTIIKLIKIYGIVTTLDDNGAKKKIENLKLKKFSFELKKKKIVLNKLLPPH